MNETINIWLETLGEELVGVVRKERADALGAIDNEKLWVLGSETAEETGLHCDNISTLVEYTKILHDLELELMKLGK